jgi:hypothetical protein
MNVITTIIKHLRLNEVCEALPALGIRDRARLAGRSRTSGSCEHALR